MTIHGKSKILVTGEALRTLPPTNREGCCAQYRKPCAYHEGWQDALDAMSDTIECPTCGGSELYEFGTIGHRFMPCPDCIRGRQPTPEVLERMAKATYEYGMDDLPKWETLSEGVKQSWRDTALAAWLAEHREEE